MTALPSKANITGSVTEGVCKTALDQLIDSLTGTLGADGTLITANQTLGTAFNGVVAKAGDYTTLAGDRGRVMNVDASGGARTITLLDAATAGDGHVIVVRKSDASENTVTVSGAVLRRTGDFVVCVSTGAAWVTMVSANDDLVPVEVADLTNGGANDLSDYAFSHALLPGYKYVVDVRRASSTNANFFVYLQVRNAAGTWRETTGNYVAAAGYTANAGFSNANSIGATLFSGAGFSGAASASTLSGKFEVLDAGNASVLTEMICSSHLASSAGSVRGYSSANVVVAAEAHDRLRLAVTPGTFDGGKAFLWRIKEPA